jgi:hypothetical protein
MLIQILVALIFWISCISGIAYYIDRSIPKIAKKSAAIGALISFIPPIAFLYLLYLYLTSKNRLVTNF